VATPIAPANSSKYSPAALVLNNGNRILDALDRKFFMYIVWATFQS